LELTWAGANGASGSAPTTPASASLNKSAQTPYPSTATNAATSRNGTTIGAGAGANPNLVKPTTTKTAQATTTTTTTNGGDRSGDDHTDGEDASSDKDVHILLERPPQDRDQN
jgi:hypothetical protein